MSQGIQLGHLYVEVKPIQDECVAMVIHVTTQTGPGVTVQMSKDHWIKLTALILQEATK